MRLAFWRRSAAKHLAATTLVWLPAAKKDQHSAGLRWTETTDPKGCLHTTEGNGWPTYQGWTVEPHATVMPIPNRGVSVRQHVPFTGGSFSLRHTETQGTNSDFCFQFELIGTSDPRSAAPLYYWPGADDAVLVDLFRKVIEPLSTAYGIPLRALAFQAYPASFGPRGGTNKVRLTNAEFDVYTGWLGHQHVPQNDHGDPGAFPWARMMRLVGGGSMATDITPASVDLIWNELLVDEHVLPATTDPARKIVSETHRFAYLASTGTGGAVEKTVAQTQTVLKPSFDSLNSLAHVQSAQIAALQQQVTDLTGMVQSLITGGGTTPVLDLAAVAKAVCDEQDARQRQRLGP